MNGKKKLTCLDYVYFKRLRFSPTAKLSHAMMVCEAGMNPTIVKQHDNFTAQCMPDRRNS